MLRDLFRRLLGLPTLAQYQALVSDNRDMRAELVRVRFELQALREPLRHAGR